MNELERKISQLSAYWGIPKEELINLIELANAPNYILRTLDREVNEETKNETLINYLDYLNSLDREVW